MKTILVTGLAGFIGSFVGAALKKEGHNVVGVDNFNDYYDVSLKRNRLKTFHSDTRIYESDLANYAALEKIFQENRIDQICHIGAQAGVRYSLQNPFVYETSNNLGTLNLFELARIHEVKSFVLSSSSSVYGTNKKIPFSVEDNVDHPMSLYAATKRYDELLAYTYHHLFQMRCTVLRLFTVYGPWGRPDMAYFKFTRAILEGEPINLYNFGKMKRDFTYIDDVVPGVLAALERDYPFEIFNLGNSKAIDLEYFVECLERELGRKAVKHLAPMQPGDVPETFADIDKSKRMLGFEPKTQIEEGLKKFVEWYRTYYRAA